MGVPQRPIPCTLISCDLMMRCSSPDERRSPDCSVQPLSGPAVNGLLCLGAVKYSPDRRPDPVLLRILGEWAARVMGQPACFQRATDLRREDRVM
jgi:hypothetical protein